ncbi:hypothetical protein SARC_03844 [Sphaeroforma arctica JP610]|uniref:MCM9 N-terminal domain-containing protein n=1 Tax=Sphaeroforma arctica JP610 TaxID=667725 RepID=A0A0L0G4T7_9EUKA|nr:hypothetical protein SARC_03844 [Sphaeroforma arctica JP610]KNC83929.1 hypothetical protein SARC_03844 [Sphaeroforma arctica JP610]|eukprot:XP_014157831.1 hypothetical protein SARC_03844 [Sphaeroforma arctica JP610]
MSYPYADDENVNIPAAVPVPKVDEYADKFFIDLFAQVLRKEYSDAIESILLHRDESRNFALQVMYTDISEEKFILFRMLPHYPLKLLPLFDIAAKEVALEIYNTHPLKESMIIKEHMRVRLNEVPKCYTIQRLPKSEDAGLLVVLRATVVRAGNSFTFVIYVQ